MDQLREGRSSADVYGITSSSPAGELQKREGTLTCQIQKREGHWLRVFIKIACS